MRWVNSTGIFDLWLYKEGPVSLGEFLGEFCLFSGLRKALCGQPINTCQHFLLGMSLLIVWAIYELRLTATATVTNNLQCYAHTAFSLLVP